MTGLAHLIPPSRSLKKGGVYFAFALIFFTGAFLDAETPQTIDQRLSKVGFRQNLDAQVPLDLTFRDETGQSVPLSAFVHDKPVILNLVYFQCPMLCTEVLNGLVRALRALPLSAGREFNVVTVSFDARETSSLAAAKKRVYLDRYRRKGAERGWTFLTGTEADIRRLADTVGFQFAYEPGVDDFAHASGIILLTPGGKVARYLYGVEYSAKDLRLGLVEASQGKISSPVEQLLLYCFHYDPTTGKYGLAITRVLQLAGLATLTLVIGFITISVWRERKAA
jgi:protein SCO1